MKPLIPETDAKLRLTGITELEIFEQDWRAALKSVFKVRRTISKTDKVEKHSLCSNFDLMGKYAGTVPALSVLEVPPETVFEFQLVGFEFQTRHFRNRRNLVTLKVVSCSNEQVQKNLDKSDYSYEVSLLLETFNDLPFELVEQRKYCDVLDEVHLGKEIRPSTTPVSFAAYVKADAIKKYGYVLSYKDTLDPTKNFELKVDPANFGEDLYHRSAKLYDSIGWWNKKENSGRQGFAACCWQPFAAFSNHEFYRLVVPMEMLAALGVVKKWSGSPYDIGYFEYRVDSNKKIKNIPFGTGALTIYNLIEAKPLKKSKKKASKKS